MADLPSWYRATLAQQTDMNARTWSALRERNVNEETPLRLDFSYNAAGEPNARSLLRFLREQTDYDVEVSSDKRGALSKKRWTVLGTTQPTMVSLEILNQWVTWMVMAGAQNGACQFDGWGTQLS